jgi:polysaccharide chain length determinant protein (PEP-CTERM system associated)
LVLAEAFVHRRAVITIFCAVNILAVTVGLIWPSGYKASTTILIDDRNIIQPLMQGAAVTTEVTDRSRLAREVIGGRKIMNQVIEATGWANADTPPDERERISEKVKKRTTVNIVGRSLINIEYRDDDPERAFRTTKLYADLFISESLGAKAAESQAAFEFIDKQTQEYQDKLASIEERLKEFRIANLDVRPGSETDIAARFNGLTARIDQTTTELNEAETKKISLEKQLSGEAEVATALSRETQYRSRIAELQQQLDTLRLSYHDTYPDIIRLRHQIEDLNEAIAEDRRRRESAKSSGRVVIDDSVINNPMYQQLKRELSQTLVLIDTLKGRIAEAHRQLSKERERGRRVNVGEQTLAELTRDYDVNRTLYQDLLRRRESARVSMNIDKERQGLTFRIQEPASLPTAPTGLRYLHFVFVGLLMGVVIPFALIYLKVQADPRIRLAAQISERQKVPVLATVPRLWPPAEVRNAEREAERLSFYVAATLMLVTAVSLLRVARVI